LDHRTVLSEEASDGALVRRCLAGEINAFGVLVDRYQRPIYNLMLRMSRNSDDASDLTQSAFVRAYEKLHTFDANLKFFSWMYRVAVNVALNAIQQRRPTEPLEERHESLAVDNGTHERQEQTDRIEAALACLRPQHRVIILLRHFDDLSYDEIARVLDIPVKTVKSRLFTARQHLRIQLQRAGT
jgi:RNA polymerase sigma-70 factor, ECF subfamily